MPFPERRSLPPSLFAVVLVVTLAALPSSSAMAFALGEATVRSSLGQKLDAVIDITAMSATESESLTVRLAPADLFAEAGLDYGTLQRALRLSVEKKSDRTFIHVGSELPITDPFLILLIEVNAAGNRTIRQYALLLDPPVMDQDARSAGVESPVVAAPPPARDPQQSREPSAAGRPARSPAAESRMVRRGDTLAQFAREALPPGATLEQTLVAFLRTNPAAFDGKNIHRMKTGSVLRVPDDQTIANVPAGEARREVALQTSDYQRYRATLAQSATKPLQPAGQSTDESAAGAGNQPANNRSSSGRIGVKEAPADEAGGKRDQLRLESAAQGGKPPGDLQADHRELAQIASEKALAEANSRIADLEKNIDQMKQQLAVRNQSLADTQKRAEHQAPEAEPHTEAAPTTAAEGSPAESSTTSPVQTPPASDATKPAKPSQPVQIAPVGDDQNQSMTAYFVKLREQFQNNDWSVPGALGALSAGLLMLWMRARLKKRKLPVSKIEPNADGQSVFGQAGGRNVDTSNSVFHSNFVPSVSQLDANEVDAIAEADVYIAYGRDEQAEEILIDALKHHPQRHALRVKLLEIYLARKDVQKFGAIAAELRVLTHGQGPEWDQAAQMGQQLDPGNLLYGGAPSAIVQASVPTATSFADAVASRHDVSAPSSVQPPLGLIRPDDSMLPASAVEDFGIKLEGLLDERRKDSGSGLSLAPMESQHATDRTPDFQLSGLAPASDGADAKIDAVALKTKIDLAMACQDIGDKEAARELLAEVAGTRHPEFASRAQSLLEQLA